nr:lysine-rich arabinogalactan protein 19-like [Aegilops tauschii subsp. strangulata]
MASGPIGPAQPHLSSPIWPVPRDLTPERPTPLTIPTSPSSPSPATTTQHTHARTHASCRGEELPAPNPLACIGAPPPSVTGDRQQAAAPRRRRQQPHVGCSFITGAAPAARPLPPGAAPPTLVADHRPVAGSPPHRPVVPVHLLDPRCPNPCSTPVSRRLPSSLPLSPVVEPPLAATVTASTAALRPCPAHPGLLPAWPDDARRRLRLRPLPPAATPCSRATPLGAGARPTRVLHRAARLASPGRCFRHGHGRRAPLDVRPIGPRP